MQIGGWERAFVARHVLQIYFGRKGREGRETKKCAVFPQNFFFVFVSTHNLEEGADLSLGRLGLSYENSKRSFG